MSYKKSHSLIAYLSLQPLDNDQRHEKILTGDLLVLAQHGLLLLAHLLELVGGALQLGLLVAQVAEGGVVQRGGLVQLGLELDAQTVQLLNALLQLPSSVVGLSNTSIVRTRDMELICLQ